MTQELLLKVSIEVYYATEFLTMYRTGVLRTPSPDTVHKTLLQLKPDFGF